MGRFLGITGTPGTGKKTLAPAVARILGLPCLGLNELLTPHELKTPAGGVDPRRLRSRLMARASDDAIVYGHMVPDVLTRKDVRRVVVLRCEPLVLKRRLRRRGYDTPKTRENLEAELIGVVSAAALDQFGPAKCVQFDTSSRSVRASALALVKMLTASRARGSAIDWVPRYSSAEKLRSLLSDDRTDSALT